MKAKAKEFIRKYKLNATNIRSMSYLQDIAVSEHFKVYRPTSFSDTIIKELNVKEQFEAHLSLTFSSEDSQFILIYAGISNDTAAEMLLHELAHIFLGHLDNSEIPAETDEAEADMLISYVKQEVYKKRKPNALSLVIAAVGIMSFAMSVNIAGSYQNAAEPVESTFGTYSSDIAESAENGTISQSESVFVTKTGSKYHKADCYHIQGSDVIELTVAEAEEAGYVPCKDCF